MSETTGTLTRASREWASRPPDERFTSLEALHGQAQHYRAAAVESPRVPYASLRARADEDQVRLVGSKGQAAGLTHWAFGQLASRVGAPAGYLRSLPADLAAANLNHGLAAADPAETANILIHRTTSEGGEKAYLVRAFVSQEYTRIWNADVTARLMRLAEEGPWQPAPAAFDGSRGLYLSDHDVFCFLVDSGRRIFEKDPNGGLSRGFFTWNSEVGARSFGVMTFLYSYVCGNHMVWGVQGAREIRLRHVGNADERAFRGLSWELRKYADASASVDEERIRTAQAFRIAGSKDEVLDKLFGLRTIGLSRKALSEGYAAAEAHSDWYGNPKSAWGMAQGITERARELVYADERVDMERAASRVVQMAF